MAQQPGYSPSFKRPAEIMRLRRRKRAQAESQSSGGQRGAAASAAGEGDPSPGCVRPFAPGPLLNLQSRGPVGGGGVKRRNPFASIENTCNSAKKKRLIVYNDDGEEKDDGDDDLGVVVLGSDGASETADAGTTKMADGEVSIKGEGVTARLSDSSVEAQLQGRRAVSKVGDGVKNINF